MRELKHFISRRCLLAGLGATFATEAVAQPYGPGHPPPWVRPGDPEGLRPDTVAPVAHIDVHMHLVGGQQRRFAEAVESCVDDMDKFRITKGVVMSPPQAPPGNFDYADFLPDLRRQATALHSSAAGEH